MAASVATVAVGTSINSIENTQKSIVVRGTIAISAGTYAAGGIPTSFLAILALISSSQPPTYVKVWSQRLAAAPGTTKFDYLFLPGTTQLNGMLQIFVQDAVAANPLEELPAGNTPAGVTGDTIFFEAVFPRL